MSKDLWNEKQINKKINKVPIEWEAWWTPEPLWMFWGRGKSLAPVGICLDDSQSGKTGNSQGSNYEDNCVQNWDIPKDSNLQS
jgi:hypothetical protein